jgi:hypothetical protein
MPGTVETRFHVRMGDSAAHARSSCHTVLFAFVGLVAVVVGVLGCYFVFRLVLG